MSTLIANPIYDSVFKYMIANEKVAKILLSALLKKKVVKVDQINNEYIIPYTDDLSVCRIDFGATISEEVTLPDGTKETKESLVTIELQKVYLASEILRFRQYTGNHYCDPKRVHPVNYDVVKEAADPMISVYILGHKLDVIDECVCYISREYKDYNGNTIEASDPFAESLTHDSIIVQVPLLPNDNIRNRVEELLQVINQTKQTSDRHYLAIDEDQYSEDLEMQEVIRTLKGAACDSNIRRRMQLEDEIIRDLKNQALAIRKMNEQIAVQNEQIAELDEQIAEKDEQIAEKDKQISQKEDMIKSMAKGLYQSGKSISEIALLFNVDIDSIKNLIKD